MTACRHCGHDPEPTQQARQHDPNWHPCPICRGSMWRTTASGYTKCHDCDHGYIPATDLQPQPLPAEHKPIPGIAARARQALTKDHP